jgi:hypothetical protein
MAEVNITVNGKDNTGPALSGVNAVEKGLGMLKTAAEAVGIAFGAMELVRLGKEAVMAASQYVSLGVTMNLLGNTAGYTNEQMAGFQESLTKAGMIGSEARQSLMLMAENHVDLAKSANLSTIAQNAAAVAGISVSEAMERVAFSVDTGNARTLRSMGITINYTKAYKDYADTIGKAVGDLNDYEKVQARVQALEAKGPDIEGAYQAALGTTGGQIREMKKAWAEFLEGAGAVAQPILIEILTGCVDKLKETDEWLKRNKSSFELLGSAAHGVSSNIDVLMIGLGGFAAVGLANGIGTLITKLGAIQLALADIATLSISAQAGLAGLAAGAGYMAGKSLDKAIYKYTGYDVSGTNKPNEDLAKHQAELDRTNARLAAAEAYYRTEKGKKSRAAALGEKPEDDKKLNDARLAAQKAYRDQVASFDKEQADMQLATLKSSYDQGLLATKEYYDKQGQMALDAAQKKVDAMGVFLKETEAALAKTAAGAGGEASPEYQQGLAKNSEALKNYQSAQAEYAKTFIANKEKESQAIQKEWQDLQAENAKLQEMAGDFVGAEATKQEALKRTADYMRLSKAATAEVQHSTVEWTGMVVDGFGKVHEFSGRYLSDTKDMSDAAKMLADKQREMAISTVDAMNRALDATRNYAAGYKKLWDELGDSNKAMPDSLNPAKVMEQQLATLGGSYAWYDMENQKVLAGVQAEITLREKLKEAEAAGDDEATNYYENAIDLQERLNIQLSAQTTATQAATNATTQLAQAIGNVADQYANINGKSITAPLDSYIGETGMGAIGMGAMIKGRWGVGSMGTVGTQNNASFIQQNQTYWPYKFASGGRPPLDFPSIIGEKGPELFIPDRAGTIVPAGSFGGSLSIDTVQLIMPNVTNQTTAEDLARQVWPELLKIQKRQRQ